MKPRIHPFDMFELMRYASLTEMVRLQDAYEQDASVPYKGSDPLFLKVIS